MLYLRTFIIYIFFTGCLGIQGQKTGHEGKIMPSFKLLLLDSINYLNTNDIPKGKPVILFYLSPHCPYCKAQLTEIIEQIQNLKNINIYVFSTTGLDEMRKIYVQYRLDKYKNIKAGVDHTYFFWKYFKVSGVPYIAIYDKDKKLIEAYLGNISVKHIKKVAES